MPSRVADEQETFTGLSLIKPNITAGAEKAGDKLRGIRKQRVRSFVVGQRVRARNFGGGNRWIPGVIQEITGPVSYKVAVMRGTLRRHVDQVVSDSGVDVGGAVVDIPETDVIRDGPAAVVVREHPPEDGQWQGTCGAKDVGVRQQACPSTNVPEVVPESTRGTSEVSDREVDTTVVNEPVIVPPTSRSPITSNVAPVRRSGRVTRRPGWMVDFDCEP